jgi:lysophospholipase L1-like esterase
MHIEFVDAGKFLLKKEGKINESLFTDGLHPNGDGYRKVTQLLRPYLKTIVQHDLNK